MNILYIAPNDPRIVKSGGMVRTALLWKALKRIGDVYTVIYGPKRADALSADVRASLERDRIHAVPNDQTCWWNRPLFYVSRKLMKNGSLACIPARKMRRAIGWTDVLFDCVVTRYIDQSANRVAWKLAPLFIDIDDMPLTLFDRMIKCRLPWLLRPVARSMVWIMQKWSVVHARGVWVTNSADYESLKDQVPTRLLRNLAPEVRANYQIDGLQERMLLTVGSLGYGPNAQGISWFLECVWPEVRRLFPGLEYAIAGGGLPESTKREWESIDGVRVLGFVDDLDAVYERACAVVTPVLTGAGTCIKTIEACSRGRKVFSTASAARGFDEKERGDLQIDLFEHASGFVTQLGTWLDYSESERQLRQREIFATASCINSFEEFSRSVREMISSLKG